MDINIRVHKEGKSLLEADCAIPHDAQFIGVLGPSGAGKTTLLRCIAGLEPGMQGNINIASLSRDMSHSPRLSLVFQRTHLLPHLNVEDNLAFASRHAAKVENKSDQCALSIEHLIEWFELDQLLTQSVDTLSGGEIQRVAIVRALLSRPDLLLLDESLSALDKRLREKILHFIAQLPSMGIRVVMVSHNMQELALLADYLLVMNDGKLTHAGMTQQLMPLLCSGTLSSVWSDCEPTLYSVLQVEPAVNNDTISFPQPIKAFELAGQTLYSRSYSITPERMKVSINAEHVSISRHCMPDSSIHNQLPVTVCEIEHSQHGICRLKLRTDEPAQELYAHISDSFIAQNSIKAGDKIVACFKAH